MAPFSIISLALFSIIIYTLFSAREELKRSVMYAYGDQWGEYVKDPDTGGTITESSLIKKNGKVPLKNNMISPILKNIDGQFRNNITQSVCVVRDSSEKKIGEMMSIALGYVQDINEMQELDSETLRSVLCGGFAAQRVEYGYNSAKGMNDVWCYTVNPARMFFNTNIEDVRGWDLSCIGEVFDMPISEVIASFSKSPSDRNWIKEIYSRNSTEFPAIVADGLRDKRDVSFFTTNRQDMCRVILGWKQESREAIFWNDPLKGTYGFISLDEEWRIEKENENRTLEATENGVLPEDILLIEYEYKIERYWYYRYLSPWGDVLQEGKSPYWHGSHNYVFHAYPMVQGKVYTFVGDFIDQQRAINRTMTLIDFIRSSSAKGVLVIDETQFESMSRKDIIDEYVRYNGVLFATPRQGGSINNAITQLNGTAAVQGDYELLNLQLKLINDISGVNSAMQGKAPSSGTASSLYAQQVQNSSLNLKGMFESFTSFRRRRDYKVAQTIQQFYNTKRHLDLSGMNYSEEAKYYDPAKVQGAQIDLKIIDGTNTPIYQAMENEFLMNLFEKQAIDVKTMLENSSLPFSGKILDALQRNEAVDPSMAQMGAPSQNQALLQKAMNDANASPSDGMRRAV